MVHSAIIMERLLSLLILIPLILGQSQVELKVFQEVIQIEGSSCNCTKENTKTKQQVEKKMEALEKQNKNLQNQFNKLQLKLDRLQERSDGHEACFNDLESDNCTGSKSGLVGIVEAIRVDGGWEPFSDWSQCSAPCGGGVQVRNRTCDNPAPENGGKPCTGNGGEQRSCNADQCYDRNTRWKQENGFCVLPNGRDQNAGVIKLDDIDGNVAGQKEKCLQKCLSYPGASTGCEIIWNQSNRGCYVHTKEVDRGNGIGKHACWIFSKRTGGRGGGNSGRRAGRSYELRTSYYRGRGGSYYGSKDYESLGCWKDTNNRAIATLEGSDDRLTGNYHERANAVEICYEVAKDKGYPAFAVQDGGWCAGSSTAQDTYKKYGPALNCAGGKGGSWANDVYKIKNGNIGDTN